MNILARTACAITLVIYLPACNSDSDARDSDADGLFNSEELRIGSDPNNPDTDNDGISDGDEVRLYGTNPTSRDTDGDGIDDNIEIAQGTDPTVVNGLTADQDLDGDGLSNIDETSIYSSDPNSPDSDGDGLTDYYEVRVSVIEDGVAAGYTDPSDPDTDGDTINDGIDNCPLSANASQTNNDGDLQGDICDPDDDNDNIPDDYELSNSLTPFTNDALTDADADTIRNIDEFYTFVQNWELSEKDFYFERKESRADLADSDGDGILDGADNCRSEANSTQLDTDNDGRGDACDADDDSDGMADQWEASHSLTSTDPFDASTLLDPDTLTNLAEFDIRKVWQYVTTDPNLADTDSDSIEDDVDNCPTDNNADQANFDADSYGDACDPDIDNDGLPNWWESLNGFSNTSNNANQDPDSDELTNTQEFELNTNPNQADSDSDSISDAVDNCPITPNADQADQTPSTSPSIGDACSADIDGDQLSNHVEHMLGSDPYDITSPATPGGGVVRTDFSTTVGAEHITRIAQQPDGKLVAVGYAGFKAFIGRYNTNGTFDTSFASAGRYTNFAANSGLFDVVILPSGKILATGHAGSSTMTLRLNANGTIDTSFGSFGYTSTLAPSTTNNYVSAMKIQDDGRIILAGTATNSNVTYDATLIRLLENGAVDSSFGSNGLVRANYFGGRDEGRSVTLLNNGKLIFSGRTSHIVSGSTKHSAFFARYDANGTLDSSFGDAGITLIDHRPTGYNEATYMQLLPGGRILALIGSDKCRPVRLNPDGSIDTTFAGGSQTTTFSANVCTGTAISEQGVLYVAGSNVPDKKPVTAAFNLSGEKTYSFGVDGEISPDVAPNGGYAATVFIQNDGKIIMSGTALIGTYESFMARFDRHGVMDSSFIGD